MPHRLVAVDPGVTTGVAFLTYDNSYVRLEKSLQVTGGREGFIEWILREIKAAKLPVDDFVCEDFILRPGVHGANIEPAFIIGAMQAVLNGKEVKLQEAGLKKLVNDDRLKKLEVFTSGKPHANDAARHGIIYLRNKKHMPTLLKGWD